MRMSLHRITITSRRFFPVSTLVFFLFLSAQSPQKILAFSVAGTGTDSASVDTTLYEVSAARLKSMIRDDKRIVELSGGVKVKHLTASITSDRGLNYPDERVTYLYDNVRVLDGTMRTRSDTGEYYGDRDVIVMKGHVSLVDRNVILHCDLGEYDRARRLATFTGNLRLSDSTRVLYADTIRYDRNTDAAEAFGHVVLIDEVENYSIAGKHGIYYTTEKRAFIDKSPILTFDLKSKEKGTVKSRWMKFDTAERIGYAIRNVRMVKGETRAECDSAVIYSNEGIVDLFGSPYATNGQSSMKGKRMRFLYDDKEVKEIILPDKGKLSQKPSKGSPWREDSWIKGDSIEIFLSNEKVDSVMIVGSCEAMYYPIETDRSKVSNDFSTGDTMYFRFDDEVLNFVRITGHAKGLYKFMNLKPIETIDSLSAIADPSLEYRDFPTEADRVIYNAVIIEYFADTEDVVLRRNASLKYSNRTLMADRIDFNSRLNVLEAVGEPVIDESGQKMYGSEMGYDLDSNTGVVLNGSTKYGEGYYQGQEIYKVGSDVLKVYNSKYTTCDLKQPHYSFRAKRMKVFIDDKIVSGPIVLYVGEMPVFYLPFLVNSIRKGRHSGFLRPNIDIGINSRAGRFIRGLGYYWATNDYTDFLLTSDFNENRSFRVHLDNRYKLRYVFDGFVRLNFYRDLATYRNEWTIESQHNQSFGKSASFASNIRLVSSDNAQTAMDQSEDIQRLVDRKIYSSGRFRKTWGGTSLNISATRNQVLNVSSPTETRVSMTFPSFSLNFPRASLWFGTKHKESERGFWESFLGSFHFSPNIRFTRATTESEARKKTTFTTGSSASFGQQQRLLFLDISPSVSMRWDYFKVLSDRINPDYKNLISSSAASNYKNEFSMSFSSGFGTKLYGTFYPRLGPLVGIRHTLNPTASYSYTPKITSRQRENRSVSYSLRNVIDLKVLSGGNEVKKNSVLVWNINGSYDPDSPRESRFSRISSSLRSSISNNLSLAMNNYYDPYKKEILSTDLSIGINLAGSFSYPGEWKIVEHEKVAAAKDEKETAPFDGRGARNVQSWSLRISYKYSVSGSELMRRVNSSIDLGGQMNLTKNWRVSYHGYYDIESHSFREQYYSLKRDLHCWQASFIHRRFGNSWSYYFQISIKAHPEIMWEKGVRGLRSFSRF
ncbi:MAG: hypothetical protein B6D63_03465 [Candidatus Latescibacteria bacterium 4484_7]|nr:MAG: hypothetical protein B6D63_03465 [Candidatus Latescibacteria bacterium 4484_7]